MISVTLPANNFLTFLLNRKTKHNVNKPLHTKFKDEVMEMQKRVDIIEEFINDSEYFEEEMSIDKLYADYISFCQQNGVGKQLDKISLIKSLGNNKFIIGKPMSRQLNGLQCRYYALNPKYIRIRNVLQGI